MTVQKLLDKLENVRKTGRHKWQACCPGHDDKSPSLAISELEDGRVLIHCFAGCGAADVLHSVGLIFADLYPPKRPQSHSLKPERKRISASDVLSALALEVLFVWQCATQLGSGVSLLPEDRDRLFKAVVRLQRGYEVACNG